jgi:hypothetical protein
MEPSSGLAKGVLMPNRATAPSANQTPVLFIGTW